MLYTVKFNKTNNFIKRVFDSQKLDIYQEGDDGYSEVVGKYRKRTLPNVTSFYSPKWDISQRRHLVDMSQTELNDLVKRMYLYDENGNHIKEAPLSSPSSPFWRHPEVKLQIKDGYASLDDEKPIERFFIACLKADPRINTDPNYKNDNPVINAMTDYKVSRSDQDFSDRDIELEETVEAIELLQNMSFDKQKQVARGMGMKNENPDPKMLRKVLIRKITDEKNVRLNGVRNIDRFMTLSKATKEELTISEYFDKAKTLGIIVKRSSQYMFDSVKLGTSVEKSVHFLSDPDNVEIKDELIKEVETRLKQSDKD